MATTELESLSLDNREPTNKDKQPHHVSNMESQPDGGEEAPSSLEHKLPETTAISMDLASQQELTIRSQEGSRGHYNPTPSQEETKSTGPTENLQTDPKGPTREMNEDGPSQMSRPPPNQQQLYLVGSRPDDAPTAWGSISAEPTWGQKTQQQPDATWDATWDHRTPKSLIQPQPRYLSRSCSICCTPMGTLNPFKTLICHECQTTLANNEGHDLFDLPPSKENGDDKQEFMFTRIPIAGEHDIAFRIGPILDGIIFQLDHLFRILVTPNYYQSLSDDDNTIYLCMNTTIPEPYLTPDTTPERQVTRRSDSPFFPLMIPGTPDSPPFRTLPRYTWPETRSEKWQRLAQHEATTPATNAQKKANLLKVARREKNKIKHAQLQHEIEVTVHYLHKSTQTTPPPPLPPLRVTEPEHRPTSASTSTMSPQAAPYCPDKKGIIKKAQELDTLGNQHSSTNNDNPEDLFLYYRVFHRYRPEMGEFNAESADRMRLIDEEILRIKNMQNKRKRSLINNVQEVHLTSDY
jgi:hypothetical protein